MALPIITIHDELIKRILKVVYKEIQESAGSVLGSFVGSSATFADLPTTAQEDKPLQNGDFVALLEDDGDKQAGLYAWSGTAWEIITVIPNMNEMLDAIIATATEVTDETLETKAMSIAQLYKSFAKINGDADTEFDAKTGVMGTSNVVTVKNFEDGSIPTVESIQAMMDAIKNA